MSIDIQREQIDELVKRGPRHLRGIDAECDVIKVFDALEKMVGSYTATRLIEIMDQAGISLRVKGQEDGTFEQVVRHLAKQAVESELERRVSLIPSSYEDKR